MTIESLSHKVSISETSVRQLTGLAHDLRNVVADMCIGIAAEKRRFEAEVYYRRAYKLLFGTNGRIKSQTLAISWFKESGDLSHSGPQYKFAKCVQDGLSPCKDVDLTTQYTKASADQHNSFGQSGCSVLCRDGEGFERDYGAAYQYARESAEQGNSLGEANLGHSYANGSVSTRTLTRQHRTTDCQSSKGQLNYGDLLEMGTGVPRDIAGAARYYRMAAGQGYAHA
jgi:TPR repeat protein